MKLLEAITNYITYRQALGELFETNGRFLKAFARTMGPRTLLTRVQSERVRQFLAGTGPITANWHAKHQALRGFFLYALSRGYVKMSPLPTVVPKRPPPFVPYIYTRQELRSILDAALTYQKNGSSGIALQTTNMAPVSRAITPSRNMRCALRPAAPEAAGRDDVASSSMVMGDDVT